jgi:hypothetical protein
MNSTIGFRYFVKKIYKDIFFSEFDPLKNKSKFNSGILIWLVVYPTILTVVYFVPSMLVDKFQYDWLTSLNNMLLAVKISANLLIPLTLFTGFVYNALFLLRDKYIEYSQDPKHSNLAVVTKEVFALQWHLILVAFMACILVLFIPEKSIPETPAKCIPETKNHFELLFCFSIFLFIHILFAVSLITKKLYSIFNPQNK